MAEIYLFAKLFLPNTTNSPNIDPTKHSRNTVIHSLLHACMALNVLSYIHLCVGMKIKIAMHFILVIVWTSVVTVSQGKSITEGNCNGSLNCFLHNCTELLNTTIEIHFPPEWSYFMHQNSCLLQNKTSIKLIGNDTVIECKEPFNIVFKWVRNLIISNIKILNCGNVVTDSINQTVYNITHNRAHFGSNFRYAIMLYQVKDITITNFTMNNTIGYGILTFNAIGNVTISDFNIQNTILPNCNDYDYSSDTADFHCSGSGLFMIYHDKVELDSVKEASTSLMIYRSHFIGNRNFLPYRQFRILVNAVNTGFYKKSIPLQGAAGITCKIFIM